jgi:hypothetical protein
MTKTNKTQSLENSFTEFLLYKTPNGKVKVEIFLKNENIWLTQEKIASLFGVDRSVITKHLKNIFETFELNENSVCAKFAQTASDGKNYQTKFYNLDAIISVGYRVNSIQNKKKGTRFLFFNPSRLPNRNYRCDSLASLRLKKAV